MLLDLQKLFEPILYCTCWAPELSPAVSTPFIRIINTRCLLLWTIIPESFFSCFYGLSASCSSKNKYRKSNRNSCFKFLFLSTLKHLFKIRVKSAYLENLAELREYLRISKLFGPISKPHICKVRGPKDCISQGGCISIFHTELEASLSGGLHLPSSVCQKVEFSILWK